jgi:hypothetical protein
MHRVNVQATLSHYSDAKVVIASDDEQRSFMGVQLDRGEDGAFLFIEIDRRTVLELLRGEIDLQTAVTERGIGLAFETTPACHTKPVPDRRLTGRKVLRRDARMLQGDATTKVLTWDLGTDGMCLLTPRPVQPGTRCRVVFDVPLGHESRTITVAVKVVYSSYTGSSGFKVGTVFSDLDEDAVSTITQFAML